MHYEAARFFWKSANHRPDLESGGAWLSRGADSVLKQIREALSAERQGSRVAPRAIFRSADDEDDPNTFIATRFRSPGDAWTRQTPDRDAKCSSSDHFPGPVSAYSALSFLVAIKRRLNHSVVLKTTSTSVAEAFHSGGRVESRRPISLPAHGNGRAACRFAVRIGSKPLRAREITAPANSRLHFPLAEAELLIAYRSFSTA
jgi:hypothetical protein